MGVQKQKTEKQNGTALQTQERKQEEARYVFWAAFFGLQRDERMKPHMIDLEKLVSLYAEAANPEARNWNDGVQHLSSEHLRGWKTSVQARLMDPNGPKAALVNAVDAWLKGCNLKAEWACVDLLDFLDNWARGWLDFGTLDREWNIATDALKRISNGGYQIYEPPKLPRCDPGNESESEYLARVIAAGKQFYRASAVGLQERKQYTEAHRHSVWLVKVQVLGKRYAEIAINGDIGTVRRAVKQRAELLELSLRLQGQRGRPRKN
jgi:hypothetical protein